MRFHGLIPKLSTSMRLVELHSTALIPQFLCMQFKSIATTWASNACKTQHYPVKIHNLFAFEFHCCNKRTFCCFTRWRRNVNATSLAQCSQLIFHGSMVFWGNGMKEKVFSEKIMECCKDSAESCRKICFHCSAFMEIAFPRKQRCISDVHKFSRAQHRKEPANMKLPTALQLNHRHLSSFVVIEIVMIKKWGK